MLFLEAGAALPVFNRNQGNIIAAQADVGRSVADARQVELRLVERLTTAFQRYENAQRQVKLYEQDILPRARAVFEQVQQLFERRGERFFDVLDAQRTLSQARLDYVDALGELWKAVSEIEGLLQQELPPAGISCRQCRADAPEKSVSPATQRSPWRSWVRC
jgi:cobalt-zinc-cadmium efflux system outer membrane protein